MVPTATVEAEASKLVGWPAMAGVTERWATGAWSGVMAMATGLAADRDRGLGGVGGRVDGRNGVAYPLVT